MSDAIFVAIGLVLVTGIFAFSLVVLHEHTNEKFRSLESDFYDLRSDLRYDLNRLSSRVAKCEALCADEVSEEASEAVTESRRIIADLQKDCEEISSL